MSAAATEWRELHLLANAESCESWAEALLAVGAQAVTFTDAGNQPILEPLPGETPLWERVCVTGLFTAATNPDAVSLALAADWPEVSTGRWSELGERPWAELWQAHFQPRHCGGPLWICPSWCPPPDPSAINLRLDPGLAFGTGDHATTALCLEWLAVQELEGTRVLDYGCGSGILAIAACLLGADHATAVDIDNQALAATRSNAAHNGISAARLAIHAPETVPAKADQDVILANILANPLIALAPELAAKAAPGARLCLSGILVEQCDAVAAAFLPWFALEPAIQRDGWARLSGRRHS